MTQDMKLLPEFTQRDMEWITLIHERQNGDILITQYPERCTRTKHILEIQPDGSYMVKEATHNPNS